MTSVLRGSWIQSMTTGMSAPPYPADRQEQTATEGNEMRKQHLGPAALAVISALALAGCSGGGGGGGGETETLTVWTIEDVAERVTAQEDMMAAWSDDSGIDVKLEAVAEDQLS